MSTPSPNGGRTTYGSLESAFRGFGLHPANWSRARELVANVDYTSIYTPPQGGYIGLARSEGRNVEIHAGYVDNLIGEDCTTFWAELPINSVRDSDGPRSRVDQSPGTCPHCFMALPPHGTCVNCEE